MRQLLVNTMRWIARRVKPQSQALLTFLYVMMRVVGIKATATIIFGAVREMKAHQQARVHEQQKRARRRATVSQPGPQNPPLS